MHDTLERWETAKFAPATEGELPVVSSSPARRLVTDDAIYAVRVVVDAYRLSDESRDDGAILDSILDAVAWLAEG